MLLIGSFLFALGGAGIWLDQFGLIPQVFGSIIIPIIVTVVISRMWSKMTVSSTYPLPRQVIKEGLRVTAITDVDEKGGLVLVHTLAEIHTHLKKPARTKNGTLLKGKDGYITEIGNILLVKPLPEVESTP